jgi:RNA polymerase sigma-70 factor (ECF subfamily)
MFKTADISERVLNMRGAGLPLPTIGFTAREDSPPSPPELPPNENVIANGDLSAIKIENEVVRLYEKNATALLRYALAICGNLEMAQDAVQEAFLRYYVALRKETASADAKGWLYSTARNYVLDRLKEYYFRNTRSLEAAADVAEYTHNPEAHIMLGEVNSTARQLLSPRELECLRLRSEGLHYKDIAAILRIDSATVGVFLARGLKKIRTALNR